MGYTFNIPAAGQTLGNSRPQVNGNFTYISTAFAINHVAFNLAGFGKHKFLQMPEQGMDPTTIADEGALYTKQSQAFCNLFWKQESGGANPDTNQGAIIQMTNVAPQNGQKGATFLPGGLLMQWNKVTLGASGSSTPTTLTYKFQLAGVDTNPYSITVTANPAAIGNQNALILGVNNFIAATGAFSILRSGGVGGTMDVFYIAIGPRT